MLWGGHEAIGKLWFELYSSLKELQGFRDTSVSALDVCKTSGRESLIDVGWLERFASGDDRSRCTVHGKVGGRIQRRPVPCSVFVALARELVLPVGDASTGRRPGFDVIDYPGARVYRRQAQEPGDEGDPRHEMEFAVEALKRGKLNRLFLTGVEHRDSSVLCLVAGADGNQEAVEVVQGSLRSWLDREGWRGADAERSGEDPVDDGPPMVLAISKIDTLLLKPDRAESRLRDIEKAYSPPAMPWLARWRGNEPFCGVHWVYNPKAELGAGRIVPMNALEHRGRADVFREVFNGSEMVRRHSADLKGNLDALLKEGVPGGDIELLAGSIARLSDRAGPRRIPELASSLLRVVTGMLGQMKAIHLGEVDSDQVKLQEERGRKHAEAIFGLQLREAASLMRSISLSPTQVIHAWEKARRLGEENATGMVSFDTFYESLQAVFQLQLDRDLGRPQGCLWRQALERADGGAETVAELATKLKLLPTATWFKQSVEELVSPMLEIDDPQRMPRNRLGAVVSARWNRCVTWLSKDPPEWPGPDQVIPKLRGRKAADRSAMAHWKNGLPQAYRSLDDPQARDKEWNVALGACLEAVRKAISEVGRSIPESSPEWEAVRREIAATGEGSEA
jgi:hypothetical protein